MRKKILTLAFALLVTIIPIMAIVNGRPLTPMLNDLRTELHRTYLDSTAAHQRFMEDYERQHQRMISIFTESNELSILLYTQEQNMTFDLAYALKKVKSDYNDFNKDRRPFDRTVNSLNIEIERYARLIEALRRLPPMMKEIEVEIVPDSLLYHNDSLDLHISNDASYLEKEVIRIAIKDSLSAPFVLDEEGEAYRDSCIKYASGILMMCAENRATVIADSTHYQEAYWRMKEAYDYAESRYDELEKYVFKDGQTPVREILSNFGEYWKKTKIDIVGQYDFSEFKNSGEEGWSLLERLSSRGENSWLVIACCIQLILLVISWLATFLIIWIIYRFKKVKRLIPMKQLPMFCVLVGTVVYFLLFGFFWQGDEYIQLGVKHLNTFLWLLIAISGSLLLRIKSDKIWHNFKLYTPTILIALVIIASRITFIPDRLIILILPVILLFNVLRQLFFCIKEHGKAAPIDSALGWISFVIYIITFGCCFMGYTFVALLILVWWYFQLAAILTIVCISDLLQRYKELRLDGRVEAMRERITYVAGKDRESLLFGATWFYDLIKQVVIPSMGLYSLPLCIHMALNVFDFNDLYFRFYSNPFVQLVDKDGFDTLRISAQSIVILLILFFALRYFNRAIHALWQYFRYTSFMRKHKRTSVRDNEINLSLDKSIINVVIWMAYTVVVIAVWRIPTGSLSLVAGGLSAGIGLALKDIINNFIYGIQLMGGRLRVGDWIECDGIRGRVTAINYQCVQMETLEGTEMSFLNASLFGKNFNNLTRNNSYEFTKIIVGVAYGTDVKKVRKVLVKAMQKMRTKDSFGREIVDPKYGVYVVVDNMSDSSVDIAVKQYVLVAERIGYVDRAKELIYETLGSNGITIPFPQCDVHLIQDDE